MNASVTEVVGLIATVCNDEGPTGVCKEVLLVAVTDHGGNEYGRATTPRGVRRIRNRLRVPTTLKVLKTGRTVAGAAFDSEYTIDCGYCE